MNGLKETCKCGHDRASHYRDMASGEYGNCLQLGCECLEYPSGRLPPPPPPKHRPGNPKCRCPDCIANPHLAGG